ncbi:TPA: hypothetical protein I8Y99_000696 [Legionella pneumophila]|nr:hypothetical protein [Legionella pneumophila]
MLKLFVVSSLSLLSLQLNAGNITQVGRYASVKNQALSAQINPLKTVQQVHFPSTVQTIGQAVEHWLAYSGFHLAAKDKQSPSLQMVLKQPLPQVDRHLGPLTISDGLAVLVGQQIFTLKHDDLLREVNFTLIKRRKA